jgi:hypothetical protein
MESSRERGAVTVNNATNSDHGIQIIGRATIGTINVGATEDERARRRHAVLRWLSPSDEAIRLQQIIHEESRTNHKLEATGRWLIHSSSFTRWLEGGSRLTWLSGGSTFFSSNSLRKMIINMLLSGMWKNGSLLFGRRESTRDVSRGCVEEFRVLLLHIPQLSRTEYYCFVSIAVAATVSPNRSSSGHSKSLRSLRRGSGPQITYYSRTGAESGRDRCSLQFFHDTCPGAQRLLSTYRWTRRIETVSTRRISGRITANTLSKLPECSHSGHQPSPEGD